MTAFVKPAAFLLLGVILGGGGVWYWTGARHSTSGTAAAKALYVCPMHPNVTDDHASDCPICGMKLVLASPAEPGTTPNAPAATDPRGLATVTIDPRRQQLIGLRTVAASRGPMAKQLRTVARIQVDPTRVRKVNVKVDGYVEKLWADFVGKPVRVGEPLFALYSPALFAAEQEYLVALAAQAQDTSGSTLAASQSALVAASLQKLHLWDVSEAELKRLTETRVAQKAVTFVAPVSGVITAKNIVVGARLAAGEIPYEITDLSVVWAMADAYESDLADIAIGSLATLTIKAYGTRTFSGRVAFIDPVLDPQSRTAKVRVTLANPKGELKPEMYAEVVLAGPSREVLRIPADAVLHSGSRAVVFRALDAGRLEPVVVELGLTDGSEIEVVTGLTPGDLVATRANFLIDSESQLRASLQALGE